MNRLATLSDAGVSIWLDDLNRERLRSGTLAADVKERSIVGVTSNPTIFAGAIGNSDDYDQQLKDLTARGVGVEEAVRMLTTADVREACDILAPVYERTDGVDGRVSIEVDPRFAHDTDATIAEARQLHWLVDRPNVMIKIPATEEGIPAIRAVLAEGISVNVTLIFSLDRYRQVTEAFLGGLEDAHAAGHDLSRLGSVASFFVSRVDSEADKRLEAAGAGAEVADRWRGKAAIANAHLAFEHYESMLSSQRWRALADEGAHPQRPLWASTSVKNPDFRDTMYVEQLITQGVVNTMPEPTIDAFADHGEVPGDAVRPGDTDTYAQAREVLAGLADAGIDFDDVTAQLEREGVEKFAASWEELLESVGQSLGHAKH